MDIELVAETTHVLQYEIQGSIILIDFCVLICGTKTHTKLASYNYDCIGFLYICTQDVKVFWVVTCHNQLEFSLP
jgi:hypothetical protein